MAVNKETLAFPCVHLNGTSKQALVENLCDVYAALGEAYDKLKQAAPNRRDYYVLPDQKWTDAQKQHMGRLQAIDNLRDELQAEIELIDAQG